MIVYRIKTKDNKIFDIRREEDSYILVDGKDYIERSSDVWYQKPDFINDEVIETITQTEIDLRDELQAKEDLINSYLQSDSTVWVGKTPNGIDVAIVMGDDKKTKVVEII